MARYRQLAAETGLWLSLGGFQESGAPPREHGGGGGGGVNTLGPPTPRIHNTHVLLDSSGATVAAYRKVHLFDAESLTESASTAPGRALAAAQSPAGALGLSVCFDLRFPEFYQALAFQHGVRVLAVPAAFTPATGEAHWELLLRARAVETQCAVVAAAQAGTHNARRASHGHAMIVDAWGRVVARLSDPHATGIAVADLGDATVEAVRARMPLAAARARGRAALGWPPDVPA